MQMDNAGVKESQHYAANETADSRARSFGQMCDRARDEMTWQELEAAMVEAPQAQRKEFWSHLLGLLDVEAKLIARQNVSMIAAPLQEAAALAIDAKVRAQVSA
ncbi:hypothetical protein KLEP174_gp45 [Pseudomonas phage vB_PcuM_ KLEP17-4]|nr:hypothetical protein KLEP174_gp45 [Pseudomonas phage vB_PcuM_ KLEP17-4]